MSASVRRIRPGLYSVRVGGRSHEVALDLSNEEMGVGYADGVLVPIEIEDRLRRALASAGAGAGAEGLGAITITAPMPGRIVAVLVVPGTQVERGGAVVILEAMKMESTITAPGRGTVAELLIQAGETVKQRQPLLRIEPVPDATTR